MNLCHRVISPRLLSILVVTATMSWAAYLFAEAGGMTGLSKDPNGCDCHDTSPNGSGVATVAITGLQTVVVGTTHSYTISVSGGPGGSTGGFNLSTDGGSLTAGTGSSGSGAEITHSSNARRSWTFTWKAPLMAGTYHFFAIAQATDGSSPNGDSWNWYGNAAGTPFSIVVETTTPTRKHSWGSLKARYR